MDPHSAAYIDLQNHHGRSHDVTEVATCTVSRGVRRDTLEGVHKVQLGVWGRCKTPSGVRGGAAEDFEIHAFQRLRTPVFALSATPATPAHTDQLGRCKIVNRPRKEGPSKNVMLLSQGRE